MVFSKKSQVPSKISWGSLFVQILPQMCNQHKPVCSLNSRSTVTYFANGSEFVIFSETTTKSERIC
jgi:hypothetical protein